MNQFRVILIIAFLMISAPLCFAKTKAKTKIHKDELAKIEWQILDNRRHSWEDAITNCKNLGKGWELPTKEDFESALNGPVLISIPEVDSRKNDPFWSQSKFDTFRVHVLVQGKIDLRDVNSEDQPVMYSVICRKKLK